MKWGGGGGEGEGVGEEEEEEEGEGKSYSSPSPSPCLAGVECRTCMGRVMDAIYTFLGHDPKNKEMSISLIS